MVRETAERIVLALTGKDIGAGDGLAALLQEFDDRKPDRTNGLASLLSTRRMQLVSVLASIHINEIISERRQPVSAICRMMSTVVTNLSFCAASRSIWPRVRYSASVSRRFRTLSLGFLMPCAGLVSMIPASTA